MGLRPRVNKGPPLSGLFLCLEKVMTEAVELDQAEDVAVDAPEVPESVEEEYDYSPPEHWSEDERTAYERLGSLSEAPWDQLGLDPIDGKELQKLWKDRYSNWDRGFNKKMQDVAEQRKAFEHQQQAFQRESAAYQSLARLTAPYVQQWHSMGLHPDTAAAQAFHWSTQFHQNPAGTLVEIARQSGIVNELAEALAGQEYIDPRTEQSQREIAALQDQIMSMQQQQQQAQLTPYLRQLQEFQAAVNDDGTPKYPYFQQVFSVMGQLIGEGRANSLEDAYDQATWAIPEARERRLADQARENAAKAKAEAERAEKAGKRVQAKETGGVKPKKSLRDELSERLATLEE